MSTRVTRFELRDTTGKPIAVHVRRDREDGSKTFSWELPDGRIGLNGLPTRALPLYGSHEIPNWDPSELVIMVEGEKARDALNQHGFHSLATVSGAQGCPDLGSLAPLKGRNVVLWPDADGPGRNHMSKLAERLRWIAASIRIFDWSGAAEGGDAADYLISGSDAAERLRVELASTQPVGNWLAIQESPTSVAGLVAAAFSAVPDKPTRDSHVDALRRLAGMLDGRSGLDRTAVWQEAVERLKLSGVSSMEAKELTRAALKDSENAATSSGLQGKALELSDPEPWPDPVNGAVLADEMTSVLQRYVVLTQESAWAVVLWVFFTYLMSVVPVATRLIMTSATKACGKTRLLTLLWALVRRALPGSSVTPAALFRVIEAHAPTLLLDEVDNLGLKDKPELLSVLNSGHTRGTATVLRVAGDEFEVRTFSTWCAIAMAGIRSDGLPDTALSRAIKIQLVRKRKADKVSRLREGRLYAELEPARRKLMRWANDHAQGIEAAEPALPDQLDGRVADNWSVLIAIADALGGEWSARARAAALVLENTASSSSDSIGEMLLSDVRDIFEARGTERLASEEIAAALARLEERPWAEWGNQHKPITKNQLARQLRAFEIGPQSIRLGDGGSAKGYYRESFEDVWGRYLPARADTEPSQRHSAITTQLELISQTVTGKSSVTVEDRAEPAPIEPCDGVTVQHAIPERPASLDPGPMREFLDGISPGVQP